MKVILLRDVDTLGTAGQIVTVADPAFRQGGIHTRWVETEFLARGKGEDD